MTLTSELTKIQYSGNDSTTVFAITYIFYADADLRVILVDSSGVETVLTDTVHYSLSGGDGTTGSLTMVTAPATGETLVIKSDADDIQETDFPLGGNLRSLSIEGEMDKIVRLVQQKGEILSRVPKFKESSLISGITFPEILALGTLRWNAAGDDLEAVVFGDGSGLTDIVFDTTPQLGGNLDVNGFTVDGRDPSTDGTKLDTIETAATADQTDAEIKTAYENNADTNEFSNAEQSKLAGIEASADVTDETNVVSALNGATLSAVTVATDDLVVIQDTSDSDNIKTVTTQAIADLAAGSSWTNTGPITLATGSPTVVTLASSLSDINEIEIYLDDPSTNTNSQTPLIQLGDSGGLEATGYDGNTTNTGASSTASDAFSSGFQNTPNAQWASTSAGHMKMQLSHMGSNVWTFRGGANLDGSGRTMTGTGIKTLSGTLTQFALTTTGGTATYDGGTAYARYR